MSIRKKLNSVFNLNSLPSSKNLLSPVEAYRIWSESYDSEKDNLMLYYDDIILRKLIYETNLKSKVILDYGCGTGRHWKEFLKFEPAKIIGCDISPEMLVKLKSKYVNAEVHLISNNMLSFLENNCCDVLISTLVIAHIKNVEELFVEWNRVLKNSGSIIITDFHPDLLSSGGARTFQTSNGVITIENYVHSVSEIERSMSSFGFKTIDLIEKKIDEDVKRFYEKQNALNVYNKFKGTSFIFGIHFSRQHADK